MLFKKFRGKVSTVLCVWWLQMCIFIYTPPQDVQSIIENCKNYFNILQWDLLTSLNLETSSLGPTEKLWINRISKLSAKGNDYFWGATKKPKTC